MYLFKNLMIKYPDEFLSSLNNLINDRGVIYTMMNEFKLLLNYLYLILRIKFGGLKRKYG